MKNENISVAPSRRPRSGLSTWEVRDNRNKFVGTFSANDKTTEKYDKLVAIAEVKNIKNHLNDIKQSVKTVFLKNEDWQVCDRAMKAISQTKESIVELDEIIKHIKQS